MKKKRIKSLIFGISGQDGSYLSHFLINRKHDICGITRNSNKNNLKNLTRLGILKKVKIIKCDIANFLAVKKLIKKIRPDEIYYLCGQSSVTESYIDPEEAFKSNTLSLPNVLEVVKKTNKKIKIFNAASGQFYGDRKKSIYNEKSYISPQSPYGTSKAASYWLVKIFRESYGIKCCNGILFNHESPLRSEKFVTKKIINHCHLIKKRKIKYLYMGDINISRDWGWAPEYVEAMYLMLRQKDPKDLVIGSGKKHSLKSFIYEAFRLLRIPRNRLKANTKKFIRNKDIKSYLSDPRLAKKILKWKAKTSFKQIVKKMIYDELF